MTAALILEARERKTAPRLVTVRQEPAIIAKAREGDEDALVEIFDGVVTSVYAFAFSATHKVREAEQITDRVIERLPRMLHRQRWDSVNALQAQLLSAARAEVGAYRRREARAEARKDLRATTRHVVLAATAFATAFYAVLLAV
jgi:hypothetical protein